MKCLYSTCITPGNNQLIITIIIKLVGYGCLENLQWFLNKLIEDNHYNLNEILNVSYIYTSLKNNNLTVAEYLSQYIEFEFDIDEWNGIFSYINEETLRWMSKNYSIPEMCSSVYYSYHNNLEVLKTLPISTSSFNAAAYNGNLEVMKWMYNKYKEEYHDNIWNDNTFNLAIQSCRLECIQWLANPILNSRMDIDRTNGCLWNVDSLAYAVYMGNIEILNWMRESMEEEFILIEDLFRFIYNNKIATVEWLMNPLHIEGHGRDVINGCSWNPEILSYLVKIIEDPEEYFPLVKLMSNPNRVMNENGEIIGRDIVNGCPWDSQLLIETINNDDIEMLYWLLNPNKKDGILYDVEYGCPIDNVVFNTAISKPKYRDVIMGAVEEMNVDIVKLFNEGTFPSAVLSYDIEFMKYLKGKGGVMNYECLEIAIHKGNLKVISWLLNNCCPYNDEIEKAIRILYSCVMLCKDHPNFKF
ncbi:Ankyrin-repeat protein [Orpheovirus IHUMI-LCC2]|uniref:Ankyrin-repeat protein n=1 Tax=Orpheovirus IHUMI-LCC2 TaxID=2023057 RepID=A0A2I2L4G6_9VIRU|nr:Ankyrin-repeat protein [Orpheovirus IHUMI-LCC2]SNW62426.1 Ankyrin-repeat protein [Orpheovirus IHUMI-LCC2]